MGDPQASPISQLLSTLGLTREDLNKRSDQMRLFLTADSSNSSRVFDLQNTSAADSPTNTPSSSSSQSSSARLLTRTSSSSLSDASSQPKELDTSSPSETTQDAVALRSLDTMEAVMERQRLARKEKRGKKDKEREVSLRRSTPYQTPPASSSVSRESSQKPEPQDETLPTGLTPQQSRYYREHTADQSQTARPIKTEAESPNVPKAISQPPRVPYYQYPPYVMPYYPVAFPASATVPPSTPQSKSAARVISTPLPPSSPPQMPSSPPPSSSPVKVNLVSSPGPMGPTPREEEYGDLPFKLPPGPYSPNKPDVSYAAILGQAILASPEHRLTLQEIYDYITIVYPYFKRGETTWMNSIRHVLSTTACFRKVVRDRSIGRTLWAIWNEDLECFKGGKFKKEFCKDMMANASMKTKRPRKQEDEESAPRKPKRAKKGSKNDTSTEPGSSQPQEALPPEVIFPSISQLKEEEVPPQRLSPMQEDLSPLNTQPGEHYSSSPSCVPDLVPNRSSSTSPPPSTSDFDTLSTMSAPNEIGLQEPISISGIDVSEDDDNTFQGADALSPVKFWGYDTAGSSKGKGTLKSGIKLKVRSATSESEELSDDGESDDDDEYNPKGKKKQNKKQKKVPRHSLPLMGLPPSPTPVRRANKSKGKDNKNARNSRRSASPVLPPSTPPRHRRSQTKQLQLSPVHTPLSHKGLHMSPSASLAHYKNHLDPPPPIRQDDLADEDDPMKTPSRKRPGEGLGMGLLGLSTPTRRLIFPGSADSPFRTPMTAGGSILSPFRAGIFDPNDPMVMLDDELTRMGERGLGESPGGLFGRARGALLYDSPNNFGDSPGKYMNTGNNHRYW